MYSLPSSLLLPLPACAEALAKATRSDVWMSGLVLGGLLGGLLGGSILLASKNVGNIERAAMNVGNIERAAMNHTISFAFRRKKQDS